jgi:hypothetical protein
MSDTFSKFSSEDIRNFYSHATALSPKLLLTNIYGIGCHTIDYQDFFCTKKVLEYLKKNKAEILEINETKNLSKIQTEESYPWRDTDKSYLYFYKDNFIRISLDEEVTFDTNKKARCSLTFFAPINKPCVDKEFLEFTLTTDEPQVYILNNQYGEFTFTKFSVTLPKTFDISLNYGDSFKTINDKIVASLNSNHSGLYMFHGPPGTGKSTYVKYLTSVVKKEVIFFPTALVHNITNPEIINLLTKKQNCILVLEDAEKTIIKRENNNDASLVSTLLNITDGILGDVLKVCVIVTYNCNKTDLDEALLRKGRLKADYSFEPLSVNHAKALIKELDIDLEPKENMTLADIYNHKSDEDLIKGIKKIEKPKIGF